MEKIYFVRYKVANPNGTYTEYTTLMVTTASSRLHPIEQADALIKKLQPTFKTTLIDCMDTNNTCYDYNGRQQHINLFRNERDVFDVEKWLDDAETERPHGRDDDGVPLFMRGE